MKTGTNELDMTRGSILPKMITFAIPLILTSLLQSLFTTADLAVVGKFGRDGALASVGATTSAANLFLNFLIGVSTGAGVCIARYYGAKDSENANRCTHTAVALSVVFGFVAGIAGIFICRPMLTLMETPHDIIDNAVLYMQIYFAGFPVILLYNFCASILRAVGDSKRCLYYIATAGVINVILNLVFVIVFDLNVAGVALATVLSQCVSAFMALRCLLCYDGVLKVDLKKLRIEKRYLKEVTVIGIPTGLQSSLFGISNVLIQSGVNSFGSAAVAGHIAGHTIDGYINVATSAIGQTVLNFTGQNFGAGRFDRIKQIMWRGLILSCGLSFVLGVVMNIFAQPLISIFTTIPAEVEVAKIRLLLIGGMFCVAGVMDTFTSLLRGLCKPMLATAISIFGICILRIVWLYTVFEHFNTIVSLYVSYPVTWSVTGIALAIEFAIVFRKCKREYEKEHQYAYGEKEKCR